MARWPLKAKVGLVLAVLAITGALFAVLVVDRGRCAAGRLDGPGPLRQAARAAIVADAQGDLHALRPDDPADRTQVELQMFCANVRGDTAIATASGAVRQIDGKGQLVTASVESYRLRLERDVTKWRVTELRNPSEFDSDG